MDYKKLTRLFLPEAIDGLMKSKRLSNDRLIEKLDQLEFVTNKITQTPDNIIIELQVLDEELFYNLLSGEANKFLLASRLSHDRSFQTQPKNASWQTVEHYYAAYYAIHYIIRVTGVSLTNLDSDAIKFILKNQLTSVRVSTIPTGLYILQYDDASKVITLIKDVKKKAGGSHKDAWKLWIELVEKLRLNCDADDLEYTNESLNLTIHKNFILKSIDKFNPPELRGAINYQFTGGSWVFEKNSIESIRKIQSNISSASSLLNSSSSKVELLVSNNKIIINLAKSIFLHSSSSYPRSICSSLANKYHHYLT